MKFFARFKSIKHSDVHVQGTTNIRHNLGGEYKEKYRIFKESSSASFQVVIEACKYFHCSQIHPQEKEELIRRKSHGRQKQRDCFPFIEYRRISILLSFTVRKEKLLLVFPQVSWFHRFCFYVWILDITRFGSFDLNTQSKMWSISSFIIDLKNVLRLFQFVGETPKQQICVHLNIYIYRKWRKL